MEKISNLLLSWSEFNLFIEEIDKKDKDPYCLRITLPDKRVLVFPQGARSRVARIVNIMVQNHNNHGVTVHELANKTGWKVYQVVKYLRLGTLYLGCIRKENNKYYAIQEKVLRLGGEIIAP